MGPWSGISTLQNCEKVHVCCLSHLVCGVLLWQGELRQPLPPLWQDTAHVRACPVISSHGLCSDPAWGDLAGQALSKFKTKLSRTEASSSCKSKAFCLTWASGTDLWSPRCLNGWRAVEQLGVTDHKWAIHWIMIVNTLGGYEQMWNCLVLCLVNSWCPVNVSYILTLSNSCELEYPKK